MLQWWQHIYGGMTMFKKLLSPDNGLMIAMTQVTDCIFLSLFWLLCCFPVVTIGPASAALYDACVRGLRRGEKHTWQRFGKALKQNLKTGVLVTPVYLGLLLGGGWCLIQVWNAAVYGQISWSLFAAAAFLGAFLLGILSLVFPLLSRFETGVAQLVKNSFLLGIANLPRTLLLGILQAAAMYVCARFIVPLFFLPAVAALLSGLFVEPILKPFMPSEENAAV